MTETQSAQAGIADALTQLSEQTRVLVRQEIEAAQSEIWNKAKRLTPGLALLGMSGAFGAFAGASLYRVVSHLSEKVLPPALAALFMSLFFGGTAAYAAASGLRQLRGLPLPVPSGTAEEAGRTLHRAAADVAG